VVEKPVVANGEPLRRELQSFIQAVSEDRPPRVTGRDGIEAVKLTQKINQILFN
jgi:predicted dehydrogenase